MTMHSSGARSVARVWSQKPNYFQRVLRKTETPAKIFSYFFASGLLLKFRQM